MVAITNITQEERDMQNQNDKTQNAGQMSVMETASDLDARVEELRLFTKRQARDRRNAKGGRFAVYGF